MHGCVCPDALHTRGLVVVADERLAGVQVRAVEQEDAIVAAPKPIALVFIRLAVILDRDTVDAYAQLLVVGDQLGLEAAAVAIDATAEMQAVGIVFRRRDVATVAAGI